MRCEPDSVRLKANAWRHSLKPPKSDRLLRIVRIASLSEQQDFGQPGDARRLVEAPLSEIQELTEVIFQFNTREQKTNLLIPAIKSCCGGVCEILFAGFFPQREKLLVIERQLR